MALSGGIQWEINGSATANNANGGGFDTNNFANFLTDLTTDAGTGNTLAPVVSSASYTFVAGDVDAWVYVHSGTSWTATTWYKIASVAGGKATLLANIAEGVTYDATTRDMIATAVVGVASVGTPTGGVYAIDYAQRTVAITSGTDLVSTNGTTNPSTVTSATAPFGANHIGNLIHVTAGASWTAAWYRIMSVAGVVATLDRAVGSAASISSGTFFVGGALSMNSTLDDNFLEIVLGGNNIFIANNISIGEAVSVASTAPTGTNPIGIKGYSGSRYTDAIGANRPVITCGANNLQLGLFKKVRNLIVTGTSSPAISGTTGGTFINCKVTQTSSTASRTAMTNNGNNTAINCELISLNGTAQVLGQDSRSEGCYIHDSNIGVTINSLGAGLYNSIIEGCRTYAIQVTSTTNEQVETIIGNTIYGREAKQGIGLEFAVPSNNPSNVVLNNIFYGLTSGVIQLTNRQFSNIDDYNNYYNNTTDITLWGKGTHDTAVDPGFVDATQIIGATATTSGSVLTHTGKDFSGVEDNVDVLHVLAGTGVTTGGYLITSHTGTTLTVNNALGTSVAGNVAYYITTGHNFAIGPNLKAAAFPGEFPSGQTTGYLDTGGVQRQEASGGSGWYSGE